MLLCHAIMAIMIWFILAQVMGVITICFEFASYQIKDQRKYLLTTSVGNIFWMLMFLFLGFHTEIRLTQAMIFAASFGVLRGLIFWWVFGKKSKARKIIGRVTLYVSLAIAMPFTILTIITLPYPSQVILQSIGLITAMLFIIGQYLPSKHYLRVFVFMYAVMVLLGNTPLNLIDEDGVRTWNYMGMVIEFAKIASVAVFYILYSHRLWLLNSLRKIKAILRCEMNKISACSDINQLLTANVMSSSEIEKLVVKMVKYEISAIDKSEMTDIKSVIDKAKLVLDNVKTVRDVNNIMQALADVNKKKLDTVPLPRISRSFEGIREVWIGKKATSTEENASKDETTE
jgi:hypothetical protein